MKGSYAADLRIGLSPTYHGIKEEAFDRLEIEYQADEENAGTEEYALF